MWIEQLRENVSVLNSVRTIALSSCCNSPCLLHWLQPLFSREGLLHRSVSHSFSVHNQLSVGISSQMTNHIVIRKQSVMNPGLEDRSCVNTILLNHLAHHVSKMF